MAENLDQLAPDRFELPGKPTTQLLCCETSLEGCLALDQVPNSLGLDQIQLTVEKGSLGELPGVRPSGNPGKLARV